MKIRTRTRCGSWIPTPPLVIALVMGAWWNPARCVAGDLPGTAEIVAKMIEAEGGAAAKQKLKNREMKLKMDFGMGGMVGNAVVYAARPGNMRLKMEIAGIGTVEDGVTDGVAWSYASMTGPQLKEGAEKSLSLWDAHFDGLLDWKGHFKNIECVSKETLDGKDYFKVVFTRHDGGDITSYVDMQSYLPYRNDMKIATPMGEIDLTTYTADYRAVDGVQYPHTTRLEVMGQKRLVTAESIKHNVELPKDCFKLPEDVQDLLTVDAESEETGGKTAPKAGPAKPETP